MAYEEDDLLLSLESPKPKGPRELPFELDQQTFISAVATPSKPALSPLNVSRLQFRERKFQNLLLGQRPVGDFDILQHLLNTPDTPLFHSRRLPDSLYSQPVVEPSPNTPYPVSLELQLDIPEVFNSQYLAADSPANLPYSPSPTSQPEHMYTSDLPPKGSSYAGMYHSLPINSALSSPSKFSHYEGESPMYYPTHSSDYSRSPSPKRPTPRADIAYPVNDIFEELYEDDIAEHRIPRWSLIEHDLTPDAEAHDTLPPNPFDFSLLPELPNATPQYSPTRELTMHTAMGFMRSETSLLKPQLTTKRLNNKLPPVPLDLPMLPFTSSMLSTQHFSQCAKIWALLAIYDWCLKLRTWVHDQVVNYKEMKKALIKLLIFHRQDISIDIIGRNLNNILASLIAHGALVLDAEQSVTFVHGINVGGVFPDLSNCYCHDDDHNRLNSGNFRLGCYSLRCLINRMIQQERLIRSTDIHDIKLGSDWATHWQLTPEDLTMDSAILTRQSLIFDLLTSEQSFIQRAKCFVEVAGPTFIKTAGLLASSSATSVSKLKEEILTPAEDLLRIHQSTLFEPLLRILVANGKFIVDLVDLANLYYDWSKNAKRPLLRYMSVVPVIENLLGNESLKNWDAEISPQMRNLLVDGNLLLMSTFNSRYQHLPLQLTDIRKFYDEHDEEFIHLTKAIESIRNLGKKVNETKVHADNVHELRMLEKHLSWKQNILLPNLGLTSQLRKFYYRGDLDKKGDLKINTVASHVILLDNYLLITERIKTLRLGYKVCENPIPIEFLIIENKDKDTGISSRTPAASGFKRSENEEDDNDYPFKIRFAGRGKSEAHTLFAQSDTARNNWITLILQAKANLLKTSLRISPYDFRLIDNSYFAYDASLRITKIPLLPVSDPLLQLGVGTSKALKERGISNIYASDVPRNLLAFGKITCSEIFEFFGIEFSFVGTMGGIYLSDLKHIWKRIINLTNVTKITVLPRLNVVLVLANKNMRYYPLQSLVDIYYERKDLISSFALSNDSILFYEVGKHKDVPMVFVAKRKSAGVTNFKVLAIETDNNGILSTFSVVKKFYIQAECYGISIFNTTIAVHTQRGFEILDLTKLAPRTIPELPNTENAGKKIDGYSLSKKTVSIMDTIKRAVEHFNSKPMGMFKLENNKEFLMVYSDFAIFINKGGRLSRNTSVRFDFRPKKVAFSNNHLFITGDEVIEVWSISDIPTGNCKLLQVITGKDISLLNSLDISFAIAHPKQEGLQLIFKLVAKNPDLRPEDQSAEGLP